MKSNVVAKLLCGATLLATAMVTSVSAQGNRASQTQLAGLDRCLRARAQQDAFSGVVSITENGRSIVAFEQGRRSGPKSPAIDARTRFDLASVTKMFTGVAIAQLVDAGKVRWTDPIGKHVTGLSPETAAVTVRQLLTHSSGLGSFFAPQNLPTIMGARTAGDLLPLIATEKPTFEPGSNFAYSNSGFVLLGVLIERISGKTYAKYLQDRVFRLAAMSDTGPDPRPVETLAVAMTSGRLGAGPPAAGAEPVISRPSPGGTPPAGGGLVLIGPDGSPPAPGAASGELRAAPGSVDGFGNPAGGFVSTAADVQRFFKALREYKLASRTSTSALISPQIVAVPATETRPAATYGYGFGVGEFEGRKWFGHNGGAPGANAESAVFPKEQWSLVVLSNRDPPSATNLFRYARDLMAHPDRIASCGSPAGQSPASGG